MTAEEVSELIDDIDEEVVYPGSKEAIENARAAYDALSDEDKEEVENYEKLPEAEEALEEAKEAYIEARKMPGTGSSSNPYRIGTAAQLERFRDIVNGENGETKNVEACAVLIADIDLKGNENNQWVPIGIQWGNGNEYEGEFYGENHIIKGLYINGDIRYAGLFGYVSGGVITDLTVEGSITTTGTYAAGIVAFLTYGGVVRGCCNRVDVTAGDTVGGIAAITGNAKSGTALTESTTIEKCYNEGEITSTKKNYGTANAGGIVGFNSDGGMIRNCYNVGRIVSTDGGRAIGGIAGYSSSDNPIIEYCFNFGNIVTAALDPEELGGIVGYGSGTIENNYYLNVQSTGNGNSDGSQNSVGITAEQFKEVSQFAGWNFDDVWRMGEDHPVFRTDYNLVIAGTTVNDLVTSGEGWSYDRATNTLTLNNFDFSGDGTFASSPNVNSVIDFAGKGDLNIVLIGENFIVNSESDDQAEICTIHTDGALTIKGEGTLTSGVSGKGAHSYAIFSMRTLTFDATRIIAMGGWAKYNSVGLYANYDGIILKSGEIFASGEESDNNYSYGIWSYGADASKGNQGTTILEGVKTVRASGDTMAIRWGLYTEIGGKAIKSRSKRVQTIYMPIRQRVYIRLKP